MRHMRGLGVPRQKVPAGAHLRVPPAGRRVRGVREGRVVARRKDLQVLLLRQVPLRRRPVRAPGSCCTG